MIVYGAEATLARRYAHALYEVAKSRGSEHTVYEEMMAIYELTRKVAELYRLLKNPVVPLHKKLAIVDVVFAGRVSEVVYSFIRLVVQKNRGIHLRAIARQYIKLYREEKGMVEVEVHTAQPLAENLRSAIAEQMKKLTGRMPVLEEYVEPELIGGVAIYFDGCGADLSVRGYLTRFYKELVESQKVWQKQL